MRGRSRLTKGRPASNGCPLQFCEPGPNKRPNLTALPLLNMKRPLAEFTVDAVLLDEGYWPLTNLGGPGHGIYLVGAAYLAPALLYRCRAALWNIKFIARFCW